MYRPHILNFLIYVQHFPGHHTPMQVFLYLLMETLLQYHMQCLRLYYNQSLLHSAGFQDKGRNPGTSSVLGQNANLHHRNSQVIKPEIFSTETTFLKVDKIVIPAFLIINKFCFATPSVSWHLITMTDTIIT